MANIQKYFEIFHDEIRTDYDMNSDLREKKDIVVNLVKNSLKDKGRPICKELLQGSYRVGTGIKSIEDLEYDIDVGLRFPFKDSEYAGNIVRDWVYEAVDGHTDKVEKKGPCIRVTYSKGFHVDLVVYANWTEGEIDQYRLAHATKGWRLGDPPAMLEFVKNARKPFEGTEDDKTSTDQFRRIVRGLKRWNDEAIPTEEIFKPTGLALLLFAEKYLQASKSWDGSADDLTAFQNVAASGANLLDRISITKPTPEYEDCLRG
jgi:hypothetical protein